MFLKFGQAGTSAEGLVLHVEFAGLPCSSEIEEGVVAVQNGIGFGGNGAIDREDGGIVGVY